MVDNNNRTYVEQLRVYGVIVFQAMLNGCCKVSRYWTVVVNEVQAEYFVNQELREEVMLMQVSIKYRCLPNSVLMVVVMGVVFLIVVVMYVAW